MEPKQSEQYGVQGLAQGHLQQSPGGKLAPLQLPHSVSVAQTGLEPATLRIPTKSCSITRIVIKCLKHSELNECLLLTGCSQQGALPACRTASPPGHTDVTKYRSPQQTLLNQSELCVWIFKLPSNNFPPCVQHDQSCIEISAGRIRHMTAAPLVFLSTCRLNKV